MVSALPRERAPGRRDNPVAQGRGAQHLAAPAARPQGRPLVRPARAERDERLTRGERVVWRVPSARTLAQRRRVGRALTRPAVRPARRPSWPAPRQR